METTESERWWWALLLLALLLPAAMLVRRIVPAWRHGPPAVTLPDYGLVADFSLVERSGEPLRRADLAGRPWFADFVYTSCPGSCPLLSAKMATLQSRVGAAARLVSFSVDPARDTPEVLHRYAQRFAAGDGSWLFVTGDTQAMRALIGGGFHLAVIDPPADEPELAGTITHSEKIVLVDASSRIRRYYDGGDGEWIEDAIRDLDALRDAPVAEARS